jgi:hypothetical protein
MEEERLKIFKGNLDEYYKDSKKFFESWSPITKEQYGLARENRTLS